VPVQRECSTRFADFNAAMNFSLVEMSGTFVPFITARPW